jgi:hypothetical protein
LQTSSTGGYLKNVTLLLCTNILIKTRVERRAEKVQADPISADSVSAVNHSPKKIWKITEINGS